MNKTTKIQMRVFVLALVFFVLANSFAILAMSPEEASNKAVSIRILKSTTETEISGKTAAKGHNFMILEDIQNLYPIF